MKGRHAMQGTCKTCGVAVNGRSVYCADCARKRRAAVRREREAAMRSCGLVKVRGACGGTYWE